MNQTYLETPEDLQWLMDVPLHTCKRLPPFVLAILDGTEDWPERITLYEVNHVNSITKELMPAADGVFPCDTERY